MFWKKPPTPLAIAFDDAIRELKNHREDSKEYATILDRAVQLHKMKEEEERTSSVSKDTLAVVGANLLGILMIIKHENVNVITTKAMSFVMKPRA
jgi:hypothetical protein